VIGSFSDTVHYNPCASSRSYCPSMERVPPSTALKPDVPPLRSAVYAALPLSGESFPAPPWCFASSRHSSSVGSRHPHPPTDILAAPIPTYTSGHIDGSSVPHLRNNRMTTCRRSDWQSSTLYRPPSVLKKRSCRTASGLSLNPASSRRSQQIRTQYNAIAAALIRLVVMLSSRHVWSRSVSSHI
jgi:hypothetical protein